MTDPIGDALRFDPLAEAERITGNSYKEDKTTEILGFGLHLDHIERKRTLLEETKDSHFSMSFADEKALFVELGFEVALEDHFVGRDNFNETYLIMWHPDGILATLESYGPVHLNMSKIYYNYKHPDEHMPFRLMSSGSFKDGVLIGNHDAREGVRYTINQFRANGAFLPVWIKRPFLWFLTYMDTKDDNYDHKAITGERISRLPEHVIAAITPS